MGTRADFYIAPAVPTEEGLEWLGSIAWDGYPDGIDEAVMQAKTAEDYRSALKAFFADRDDVTLPDRGWPWPWNNSLTTDYGYVLIEGRGVFYSPWGTEFFAADGEDDEDGERVPVTDVSFVYPDMSASKNVRMDGGSGLMVFRAA